MTRGDHDASTFEVKGPDGGTASQDGCAASADAGTLDASSASTEEVDASISDAGSGARLGLVAVSAGHYHTCALTNLGEAYCWGEGSRGQLGNGSATTPQQTPEAVANLTGAKVLNASAFHSCALRNDATLLCWGDDAFGQLGHGVATDQPVRTPVRVPGLTGVRSIAGGDNHACAVLDDGQVNCWGDNSQGQLGDGTLLAKLEPVKVPGIDDAIQVELGAQFSCALRANGQVLCWGYNGFGQLGDGTLLRRSAPAPVLGLEDAVQIDLGQNHACALRTTGEIACWGVNLNGELGDGTTLNRKFASDVLGVKGMTQLSVGAFHACALGADGRVSCWGYGGSGALGDGQHTESQTSWVQVAGLTDAKQVTAGAFHSCALRSSGEIACWGYNADGQLGDGTLQDSAWPVATRF